jgi:GH35 family endo-1,4-beta-xylanase
MVSLDHQKKKLIISLSSLAFLLGGLYISLDQLQHRQDLRGRAAEEKPQTQVDVEELAPIPHTCPEVTCGEGFICQEGNCLRCGTDRTDVSPLFGGSLREFALKRGMMIGATIQDNKWNLDPEYKATFAKEFNSGVLFAPMNRVEPERDRFDFSKIDPVLKYAREHHIRLLGGSLIYGPSSTPNRWLGFHEDDCGGWDKEEIEKIMRSYIRATILHVGSTAYAWKVVNEPLTVGMKNSCWSRKLGGVEKLLASEDQNEWRDNYLAAAFRYAHEVDPKAFLILNDHFWTGGVERRKTDEFMKLIGRLKQVGVPVHVAGIEMHLEMDKLRPSYQNEFRYFLEKAREAGVQVYITEMDVYQGRSSLEEQKDIFKTVLATCLEYSHCTNFTTWGLTDKYSWLRDRRQNPLPDAQPLLFDGDYRPKPAYYGVLEALKEDRSRDCFPMAEIGKISILTDSPKVVTLKHSFADPVVFAQPLSRNGGDPAVVRIADVRKDRFSLYVQDAPNMDSYHVPEAVSYLVVENGPWQLESGHLEAGKIATSATVGQRIVNGWETVFFSQPFGESPVLLTQVQTAGDPHWVKTRQHANRSGFQVALEEEEVKPTRHGRETVGWLALERGVGSWDNHPYEAEQTEIAVGHNWYPIIFGQTFDQVPAFLAAIATYRGADNAELRIRSRINPPSAKGVEVLIEEDTTLDDEIEHNPEAVNYLAIEGDGVLNAALGRRSD